MSTPTYAYLGPAGTFTEEAALLFSQGSEVKLVPCATIPEVFEMVDSRHADYGVVPIENSLEGSVNATLDAFAFTSPSHILGELTLDIHHSLITAPGANLAEVTRIVSHPQALGQCSRYISREFPGREIVSASSTAAAVQSAVNDPSIAAIANSFAAKMYDAEVRAESIEDVSGNQTRFVLIGKTEAPGVFLDRVTSETYKTSLALFLRADKPGALLMILSEFAYAEINLSKIQSRPTKQGLGEYMFFMDIESHAQDPDTRTALDSLRLKLRDVKVLGSYLSL